MLKSTIALICFALMLSSFSCQEAISPPAPVAETAAAAVEVPASVVEASSLPDANVAAPAVAVEAPATEVEVPPTEVEAAPATEVPAAVVGPAASSANVSAPLPPSNLTQYLIEPYFYSNDPNTQFVAFLFCQTLDASGVIQCAIYDGSNATTGRLLGTEYVVNETLYNSLAPEEQQLWHSHAYGVQSGNIIAPALNGTDYINTLTSVAGTYGKAVLNWASGDGLPTGVPILAYAFTGPNQFNADTSQFYDNVTNTTAEQRTANNANIVIPAVADGANDWATSGVIPVFQEEITDLDPNLWGLDFQTAI